MRAFGRYLTEEEQARLLKTVRQFKGPVAERDAAVIALLLNTGLRLKEFCLLSVGCALAALRSGYIYIPKANRKGKHADHQVFVTAPAREALEALLAVRAEMTGCATANEADPLVLSRELTGITPRAFEYRMKRWAVRAGLSDAVSPHWLRHTHAKNIVRRSTSANPLGIVQRALGHAALSSTGVYTAVDKEEMEAALVEVAETRRPGQRVSKAALRREFQARERRAA